MIELFGLVLWGLIVLGALALVWWYLTARIYRSEMDVRNLLVEQATEDRIEDLTINALLLTDVCMKGPLEQNVFEVEMAVAGWTRDERIEAFRWASLEHLHANDNPEVVRIPCPPHVQTLRGRYFP